MSTNQDPQPNSEKPTVPAEQINDENLDAVNGGVIRMAYFGPTSLPPKKTIDTSEPPASNATLF